MKRLTKVKKTSKKTSTTTRLCPYCSGAQWFKASGFEAGYSASGAYACDVCRDTGKVNKVT